MGIIAKAMELGNEIANSTELKSFREAEAAVLSNSEAYELVRKFTAEQHKVREAHMNGTISDELRQSIQAIHTELMQNPIAKEYIESQRRFDQVIQNINYILQQAISGNSCSSGGG